VEVREGTIPFFFILIIHKNDNEMVCQEKVLLISIKPSVDEFGQDVILGTAMDMTGVSPCKVNQKQNLPEENKNFKIVM
jgi:hypothetical protein